MAAERFDSPAQVALAWLLHKPGITAPIVGATKLEHLEEAIAAANLSLSAEEIERLEEPYVPHPVLGPRVAAVEGPAPSPPETWDALFSDFYLRAFANEEADADAGANAQSAARLAACPAGRRPARRALRVRAPRDPAGARGLPRDGRRPLADAARRGPAAGGRRARPSSSRPTTASCPSPDESFDAALNLFTSLGFYGDEEDVKALAEIGRVLRPTGRLVIETMHRDRLVRGFHEQDWRLLGEGRLLLEQRSFDAAAGVAQTTQTLIEKTGERDSRTFSVRVYTATELVAMLNRAGFDDARCYGDLEGGPFDTTTRLVIVARR